MKKTKTSSKHKSNSSRRNRPPGIIHVYQSAQTSIRHEPYCFDTDDFTLLLCEMFSLCLPGDDVQQAFIQHSLPYLKSVLRPFQRPSVPHIPIFIKEIKRGFKELQLTRSSISHHDLRIQEAIPLQLTHELHGAFMLDCTLSRTHRKPRFPYNQPYYEVIHRTRTSRELCSTEFDHIFRTVIIIFPYASVFWTTAFTSDNSKFLCELQCGIGKSITTSSLTPLPLSWLRLVYTTGEPALGSFIKSINRVWTINYVVSNELPKVIHSIQFDDGDVDTPLLPPDCIGDNIINKIQDRRTFYRALFEKSGSNKIGCRRYVTGALYRSIRGSSAYILNPRSEERRFHAFQTTILDSNKRPVGQSYIVVSYVSSSEKLYHDFASVANLYVSDKNVSSCGNSRRNTGDNGQMSGYGITFHRYQQQLKSIPISMDNTSLNNNIGQLCSTVGTRIQQHYPGILPLFTSLRKQADIDVPQDLGGTDGFCSNIAVSVDLENSSHVDINDASVCFVVFSETMPHTTKNWFFIFPDVLLKRDGRTYNGLVIELSHGVTILFDGRVIRHCTSKHECAFGPDGTIGHTVGWFFGTSFPALTSSSSTTP